MYGALLVLSVIRNSLSLFLDDALCPSDGLSLRFGRSGWNYTRRCWFAVVKDAAGVWKYQTRLCLTAERHTNTQVDH